MKFDPRNHKECQVVFDIGHRMTALLEEYGISPVDDDDDIRYLNRDGKEVAQYQEPIIHDLMRIHEEFRKKFFFPANVICDKLDGKSKRIEVCFSEHDPSGEAWEPVSADAEHHVETFTVEDLDEDCPTMRQLAAQYLKDEYVDHFSPGCPDNWYTKTEEKVTGTIEEFTYHLKGFTPQEEEWVLENLKVRGAIPS